MRALNTSCANGVFLSVNARGVGYMQNMPAFQTVCPLRHDLHLDITTAVKVTTQRDREIHVSATFVYSTF